MKTLSEFLSFCLSNGKYFFSKQEAVQWISIADVLFHQQANRLKKSGKIKRLGYSLYMIIPDEYRHMGSLPSLWIADALFKHIGKTYYIGLLSAAGIYGATHQQPMTFQVIAYSPMKPISLSRGSIEFHTYKHAKSAFTCEIKTQVGTAKISSRAQTMVDLLRFQECGGHLNNVATIIRDLREDMKLSDLKAVVALEKEKTVLQRLGFIFDFLGLKKEADIVEKALRQFVVYWSPLFIAQDTKQGEKIKRWKIIMNDTLELEE